MATCEECLHIDVCEAFEGIGIRKVSPSQCGLYKPAADVVEVVRCKDCEWWAKQNDSAQGGCALLGIYPTGAWYCGNGRKRR